VSFAYNIAKFKALTGAMNLESLDVRMALIKVPGSTTTDTEKDKATLSAFTTLGELVATNYVRKALAAEDVVQDNGNNRAEFMVTTPITWTSLGGGANDTIGAVLVYCHVTNDADSWPIAYIDNAGASFGITTNGSDFSVNVNAEGLLQLTD
jgi:hypothetical protein